MKAENTDMSYTNDFIEGMGSVYDVRGDRHFNDFNRYPTPNGMIRNIWFNVGVHIDNAVSKLGKQNGIGHDDYQRRCVYDKF